MNTTEQVIDDIELTVPTSSGDSDEEPIEPGAYAGKLVGFHVDDKPQWKIEGDKAKFPDKEPDPRQWAWVFELTEGEYEGRTLTAWTSRNFHPKANAHKYAAALLGVAELTRDNGMSTKQLIGLPCQVWINQSEKSGKSYVDKIVAAPKRKSKAAPVGELEAQFKSVWNELKGVGWQQSELLAACKDVVPDFALFGKLTTPEQEAIVAALRKLDRAHEDAGDLPF